MKTIISVVIPSYKPGDYIWECLESLDSQTLNKSEFEILLVLNGCNEPWKSQIQKWHDSHPDLNINLIQTDTPGVSNARNLGLFDAKGDYVCFIDDDDYVSSDYLKSLLGKANENNVVVAYSQGFISGSNEFLDNYKHHQLFMKYAPVNEQKLYKVRSFLNNATMKLFPIYFFKNNLFDTSLQNGEDGLLMSQISNKIKEIGYTNTDAVYYRRYRSSSLTTSKRRPIYWLNNIFTVHYKLMKTWLKSPLSYNLLFIIIRMAATVKCGLFQIFGRIK